MRKYSLDIVIDSARANVAKLYGDPENLAFWQPGFLSIEPVGDQGETGKGRYRLLYRQGKREIEMIETVEVNALPDEYTAQYDAKGISMRVHNRFEEIDGGKTRWVSDNEAQTKGILMKLFGILMPGCFEKESYKYMVNFKAFVETGADVRKLDS